MKYNLLRNQSFNCWYQLSFRGSSDNENPAIVFRIHQSVKDSVQKIRSDTPMVKKFAESLSLDTSEFSGDLHSFGFKDFIQFESTSDHFVKLVASLPTATTEECPYCAQTTQEGDSMDCFSCGGSGKITQPSDDLYVMLASISLLLKLLNVMEKKSVSDSYQLMSVKLMISCRSSELYCGIGANISQTLVKWASKKTDGFTRVEKAMQTAYERATGRTLYDQRSYRVKTKEGSGWLSLTSPGDRCGLNPKHNADTDEGGYELVPHNVDTFPQTLTLLSGLAALHDEARIDMG